MKKMTLFLGSLLFSTQLFSNTIENKVINFEKNRLANNPNIKINSITISSVKELPLFDWKGYILQISGEVQGKAIEAKDILFSDGEVVSIDLFNIDNGKSFKSLVNPDMTSDYYDKSKLIAGNHDSKDKIVVFSDPLCPFCMDFIPEIINHVNGNKNIALYYYHFPLLQSHPASLPLAKLMAVAKKKNIPNIELKVYQTDWDEYFKSDETNPVVILKAFNEELNTSITLEEIMDKKIENEISHDMKMADNMMVRGTPTIYVNGKKDTRKTEFRKLGKK